MASTTTPIPKTLKHNYSPSQFATDLVSFIRSEPKDMLEVVMTACDWLAHLGYYKEVAGETSAKLNPVKQGFSIFDLFHHINGLRDQIRGSHIKNPAKLKKDVFDHVTLGIKSGAEFAMFLDTTKFYVFKEGMKSIKTTFWMALGVFDVVNLYSGVGKIKEYHGKLDRNNKPEAREILESRINLTYLKMLQSATLVAMAAISIISIVFAAAAQGFLFSPVVMLGLSSAWLVLQFVNHFYDKIITHRNNQLPATIRVAG